VCLVSLQEGGEVRGSYRLLEDNRERCLGKCVEDEFIFFGGSIFAFSRCPLTAGEGCLIYHDVRASAPLSKACCGPKLSPPKNEKS